MLFNSYSFVLAFLSIFVIAYSYIRHFYRGREEATFFLKLILVIFSIFFYVPFGGANVIVLFGLIVFNILMAQLIIRGRDPRKGPDGKACMILGVTMNLVALLLFKYNSAFFPIAVSFYTFNQVSFLIDLYRCEIAEFNITDYLAYILYFPKIVQGPLQSYSDFSKEVAKSAKARFNYETLMRGLFLFSIGLFKKVILADTFGEAVTYGYNNLSSLGSLEALLVSVFYSFQLYFDFSGYCDMAAAVSMMIGIELPVNFNSPYKARNISDFWKRWHITLTGFFTKYLYIPLGGNRLGNLRTYVNIMIVFFVSGMWHGNSVNFVVWGVMHGVMIVVYRVYKSGQKSKVKVSIKSQTHEDEGKMKLKKLTEKAADAVKIILTFAFVNAAWVFFRAKTLSDAVLLFTRMLTGGKKALGNGLTSVFRLDELWYVIKVTPLMNYKWVWNSCLWLFLIGSAIIIFFGKNAISTTKKLKVNVWTTLFTVILMLWSIVSFAGVGTFLYMNF